MIQLIKHDGYIGGDLLQTIIFSFFVFDNNDMCKNVK